MLLEIKIFWRFHQIGRNQEKLLRENRFFVHDFYIMIVTECSQTSVKYFKINLHNIINSFTHFQVTYFNFFHKNKKLTHLYKNNVDNFIKKIAN